MKKNKSKFKNVEDRIEDTDKKLCEFKSLIEQIKTEVEELCPDEVEGNKQAQKILQDMITNYILNSISMNLICTTLYHISN